MPYHRSFEEDVEPLPARPVELAFDLRPTSNIFDADHRIRVTVPCTDADNYRTLELSPGGDESGVESMTTTLVRRGGDLQGRDRRRWTSMTSSLLEGVGDLDQRRLRPCIPQQL